MTKNDNVKKSKMEELLSSPDQPVVPKVGQVAEGTVISASNTEVHLDIDGLTTGVVRGRELIDESGLYNNLKVGDRAQATVLDLENENEEMELSFRQAGHQKAWNDLAALQRAGTIIAVSVIDANKGGLMIQVGRIDGFLPVSQLTVDHYPRVEGGDKNRILELLRKFNGQKLRVRVIDVNEEDSKLIVSEKAAWEEKQHAAISQYKVGDVITGKVTGVVDFGAFIEFGDNLEGLVHISELAWQRIDDPRQIVNAGDEVKAKVISIEGAKISLSMKALKEDPWRTAMEKYKEGQAVEGKVLKVNPFGIFVELDKDIHGLAHISELSHERINDPTEVVKIGETYKFKILSIEPENHRLGLSLKALKEKKAVKITEPAPVPPAESSSELSSKNDRDRIN